MDSPEIKTKTCTGCGQTKPATRQFFHYNNSSPDGLRCKCIVCISDYNRNSYTPSNEKPRLTTEEIAEIDAQTKAQIYTKTLPKRMAKVALRVKYASVGFTLDGVKYKIKVCEQCEIQKPATEYFFDRCKQNKDGLATVCRECEWENKIASTKCPMCGN